MDDYCFPHCGDKGKCAVCSRMEVSGKMLGLNVYSSIILMVNPANLIELRYIIKHTSGCICKGICSDHCEGTDVISST